MHVAMISTFPPQACGIATYTKYLLDGFDASDPTLRVTVLSEYAAGSHGSAGVIPSFDAEGEYEVQLLARLSALDVDIVHLQHEYGIFGLDDRLLRLLRGVRARGLPIVLTMHTVHTDLSFDLGCSWRRGRPSLEGFEIEKYQREVCELADAVVTHQKVPMGEVLIRQGVDRGKVRSIPHGTRIPVANIARADGRRVDADPAAPTLLAFGYFEVSKNVRTLLEAFSLLLTDIPQAQLVVGAHIRFPNAENLAALDACRRVVEDQALVGHVTFTEEPVPEVEVEATFASADVACLVYDEDSRSSSGAAHRAIGCAVPVIAARISKFAEIAEISDELLVDPHSPKAIARLLHRVLTDEVFQSHIAARAHSFAEATSWNRVAIDHMCLYRSLVGLGSARHEHASSHAWA